MKHKSSSEKDIIHFESDNTVWYNKPFTMSELNTAIKSSSSSSPGPDTIPNSFYKHFNVNNLKALLSFYNYIFENGFPHQWRESHIIPILKPMKPPREAASYRPIALTNCMSKIMEKMINCRLQHFLEHQNYYSPHQSGFRATHSTTDAIIRLEYSASYALLTGQYCIAVFLDIAGAFDSVWHYGLLRKIRDIGLKGYLAEFIKHFLNLRRICVKVGGFVSSPKPLYAGVPQGAVISPSLFTILINDLFDNIPKCVENSLYADDGALWFTSPSLEQAVTQIQSAMNSIMTWSQKWGLQLSLDKTKALIFTRKRLKDVPKLYLFNSPIKYTNTFKFLGITFDKSLTWRPHIEHIKEKCHKDLQLLSIISSHKWGADCLTLRKLYLALTLPKLDYGSPIYANAAKCHLTVLDRIQYKAARIILGALRCTPTYKLEVEANLMPLQIRRNMILTLYGCRIMSTKSHPVRNTLTSKTPLQNILGHKYILPAIDRLHDELKSCNIDIGNIPIVSMENHYMTVPLPIYCSLYFTTKSNITPTLWKSLYLDLVCSKYLDRRLVFTDGSKKADLCSSAVWSEGISLVSRLPNVVSIYTAELYALYMAVIHVSRCEGQYLILTDSLSSITALQNKSKNHYLIKWIYNVINKCPTDKIVIEWIPSHVGIQGNEKADKLANECCKLKATNDIPLPSSEIRSKVRHHYQTVWQNQWSLKSLNLVSFKKNIGDIAYSDLPRRIQIVITRIRLNTTLLTHQHHFNSTEPPQCHLCSCKISLTHLFIDCPLYDNQRKKLQDEASKLNNDFNILNITNPPFPALHVLKFLEETNFHNCI